MNKESLKELKEIIMNGLDKSKTMDIMDKTELMLNFNLFLKDKESYEDGIKLLKMNKKGNKHEI